MFFVSFFSRNIVELIQNTKWRYETNKASCFAIIEGEMSIVRNFILTLQKCYFHDLNRWLFSHKKITYPLRQDFSRSIWNNTIYKLFSNLPPSVVINITITFSSFGFSWFDFSVCLKNLFPLSNKRSKAGHWLASKAHAVR